MKIQYTKKHKDGSVEILTPHQYAGGKYRVEIEVTELEMIDHVKNGARVRMSGPISSASVVPPDTTP